MEDYVLQQVYRDMDAHAKVVNKHILIKIKQFSSKFYGWGNIKESEFQEEFDNFFKEELK